MNVALNSTFDCGMQYLDEYCFQSLEDMGKQSVVLNLPLCNHFPKQGEALE